MRIGVSGANGLIGKALVHRLAAGGHEVVVFGRRAVESLPLVSWDVLSPISDPRSLDGLDAFVHLAGTPIAEGRWTAERKELIRRTRVVGTAELVRAFTRTPRPPRVLVSASAVGFYGNRGNEILDEESPAGTGYLPEVCQQWEAEALRAREQGIRVVLLRTGVVLSLEGGALARMLTPFRLGLGGRLGDGSQYFPWIHLEDEVALVEFALDHQDASGPLNGTAPNPVTNREFTKALASELGRPAWFPVPAPALRIALGEMAEQLLLEGQRVIPRQAQELGFGFRFPDLKSALRDLLGR